MLVDAACAALRRTGTAGWLFYNVYHRDAVADMVLHVPGDCINSRPWLCLLRPDGAITKVVHRVEAGILEHIAGETLTYASRQQLLKCLGRLRPAQVAAQCSTTIPRLSSLDLGAARTLEQAGLRLESSELLVQLLLGTLTAGQMESHERAAAALYEIVPRTWRRLVEAFVAGDEPTEGQVRRWLSEAIAAAGLVSPEPPIVAFGSNSADPHYAPEGAGAKLRPGKVVQLDLWGREQGPDGVFGDISWVGVAAARPTPVQQATFIAIAGARDAVVTIVESRLASCAELTGAQIDEVARTHLGDAGLLQFTKHRTGHSIDRELHGYGVNLDSSEFPDSRPVLEGSCFSVEPGVYQQEFGQRTEVDVYIRGGRPVVSGGPPQGELLTIPAAAMT